MNESVNERYLRAKRALFDKAYGYLNEKQRESVFTVRGPLLILAGAGSGKTTVLVKRIAFLIKYGNAYFDARVPAGLTESRVAALEGALSLEENDLESVLGEFISDPCPPWKIMAITFTNKAANEIKARLSAELGDEGMAKDIWTGTFHSVCMRILRAHVREAGYQPGFSIYDTTDQKKAVAAAMSQLNIDEKTLPLKTVINAIGRAKDRLLTPALYEAESGADYRLSRIARVYAAYQARLHDANAMDFDDIIMQTVFLLRDHPEVLSYYQAKFQYVCVDEYQDTNECQFKLAALLAGGYRNLMVVGDDDQSIYRFRGATIENILGFDKVYEDARVIKLEQNYRSTQNILSAANAVIGHNANRKGKTLWTDKGSGEKIHVKKLEDQNAESRYLANQIQRMVIAGEATYRDIAILYRTNAQADNIERTFVKSGVPYRVLGGVRYTDRKEIRDIVAYLQVLNNHNDRERLLRIINEPSRKIGAKTIAGVEELAVREGCGMFDILEKANIYPPLSKSANRLMEFAALIRELSALVDTCSLETLINEVLDRSGYRQMLIDGGEAEAERLDNLNEFISSAIEYEGSFEGEEEERPTLTGFLEEIALVSDVDKYDESADAVVMMTIHSAKGLEFPVVFLPGMEDGIFPGMQSIMASAAEIEEERRLAYVAITRAKKRLTITHTTNRMLYGRTQYNPISRFVTEIPETYLLNDAPPRSEVRPTVGAASVNKSYFRGEDKPRYDTVTVTKRPPAAPAGAGAAFEPGDRVVHPMFGGGEILSAKKMGADILYEVMFDSVGTKKLMASFAKMKKE